ELADDHGRGVELRVARPRRQRPRNARASGVSIAWNMEDDLEHRALAGRERSNRLAIQDEPLGGPVFVAVDERLLVDRTAPEPEWAARDVLDRHVIPQRLAGPCFERAKLGLGLQLPALDPYSQRQVRRLRIRGARGESRDPEERRAARARRTW